MWSLWQDVRYSARMLLKNPGFSLIAILTLCLGIGATTTIFSSADATLLRPFSFPNQARLVMLFERNLDIGVSRASVSPGNVIAWREQTQTLQEIVVMRNHDFTMTSDGAPERHTSYGVSAAFFDALGAQPQLGRVFQRGEDEAGHAQVVVLKHGFWQTRFGGDPQIIGKQITLDDNPFTVIGVMPKEFDFPLGGGEMWTPFVFDPKMRQDHANHYLRVLGLLKPGVTVAQAGADLQAIAQRIQRQFPNEEAGHNAIAIALNDEYTRGARIYLPTLIGSALFVLLIACSNVANLSLARVSGRVSEIAVRSALGAARWRLIRFLLTESLMLALIGGALGLALAGWSIDLMAKGIPPDMSKYIPGWSHLGLNYTVLAFTTLVSILTGVVFGLAPALQSTKTNLTEALKAGGGKGVQGASGRGMLRNALVVTQLAIATILLVGAGLFVRSFIQILRADLGVKPDNTLTLNVALPRDKYSEAQRRRNFFQQLLQRVGSAPGVVKAGGVDMLPIGQGTNTSGFQVVGQPSVEKGKEPQVDFRIATPEYFAAIGTDLRKGRLFNAQDDENAPRVALVNEAFAARYLKGGEAVGQHLNMGLATTPIEIIGVVANVINDDLDDLATPGVYLPFSQNPSFSLTLVVRASGDPAQITPAVRSEISGLDPRLPLVEVKTMSQVIYERRSPKEMMMWTLLIFGFMSLLMAAVGTYAVMAYAVAQRRHEIGVRIALGALPLDILKLTLRRGLSLALIGVGMGLAGALVLTRALARLLYDVTATDPITFGVIAALLAGVSLLACYLPARRATKVDPLIALRHE
jgi:putative ABC transport system permease protein